MTLDELAGMPAWMDLQGDFEPNSTGLRIESLIGTPDVTT